jgi:hypothetical protein
MSITFYSMGAGCGFCVKAEQMLAPQIKSGVIVKRNASEAPQGKFQGFPAFEYNGATHMGLPKSFEELAGKLNFTQENYGVSHNPFRYNAMLPTAEQPRSGCSDVFEEAIAKLCKTQKPDSKECETCVDTVWKNIDQSLFTDCNQVVVSDNYNGCEGGSQPVPHTEQCPDGCPSAYCDSSGNFKKYPKACNSKSPGGPTECCRCASSVLDKGQCAQGCVDNLGGECIPGTGPSPGPSPKPSPKPSPEPPHKWTKALYQDLLANINQIVPSDAGLTMKQKQCVANGLVAAFPDPTTMKTTSMQDKSKKLLEIVQTCTAASPDKSPYPTPVFEKRNGGGNNKPNSPSSTDSDKKKLQPWEIGLIVGGSILGFMLIVGIIMGIMAHRRSPK